MRSGGRLRRVFARVELSPSAEKPLRAAELSHRVTQPISRSCSYPHGNFLSDGRSSIAHEHSNAIGYANGNLHTDAHIHGYTHPHRNPHVDTHTDEHANSDPNSAHASGRRAGAASASPDKPEGPHAAGYGRAHPDPAGQIDE